LPTDLQSIPAVKEAADLPSFVKRFNDQSSELGRRTRIPGTDAKPEEIKAFKESVYKAGLWKAPPESPDKYDIKRPDNVPEHAWSDKTVQAFRGLAHKHGLSQEAMKELIDFDAQRFGELEPVISANKEEAKKVITEQWQKEGRQYDEMMNLAVEGVKARFSAEEVQALESTGLLDHPYVLSGLAKIGELYMESGGLTGDGMSPESKSAEAEANDILRNEANPKFKQYWSGDKDVVAHVNGLFAKAYPGTREL